MDKLKIETLPSGMRGMNTMKISGFRDGELEKLKSMKHSDAKEKLLDMLNDRNNGIAQSWYRGYGIFGLWFDNEAAYLNIGSSCD